MASGQNILWAWNFDSDGLPFFNFGVKDQNSAKLAEGFKNAEE